MDRPEASHVAGVTEPEGASRPPHFSVIDALDGFVRLGRRPETFSGTISLRAATCKPFTDANATGVHVWFSQPVVLSRDPGRPDLQMTDELLELVMGRYEARLDDLTARGLLSASGHWQGRLREGPIVRKDGVTSIWTGLLVKPEPGLWLLATGAYNRRSWVTVRDVVIGSDAGYTPLVLEFELDTMVTDSMWLETELATLVPLRPDVTFSRATLDERPELGKAHSDFYGSQYIETRATGKSVGRYRKVVAQAPPPSEVATRADCQLVHISGPDLATIETFPMVVGPAGPLPPEAARRLQFAVLRNITPLEFDFDGAQFHLLNDDADPRVDELLEVWRRLYGETPPFLDWWTHYFVPNGADVLGQPLVLVFVYSFIETPPGWSSIGDVVHHPRLAGQRGIVATDLFHHVGGAVLVAQGPGTFRIEEGAPLMRVLPVPRQLLAADYRVVGLDDA